MRYLDIEFQGLYDFICENESQDKNKLLDFLSNIEKQLTELKDKLSRRNMQIKDLKKRVEELETNAVNMSKEYSKLICKHCPELEKNPERRGNFGCLGCQFWSII